MITLIILSLAGMVIAVVVGTFWYSNATPMGRLHMRYLGFDKPKMPKIYAAQVTLSLLTSFAVAFVVTLSIHNGVPVWMAIGFLVFSWLCFTVPTIGQGILWGNCDPAIAWNKFFSDSASNLLTILLIAGLAVAFA